MVLHAWSVLVEKSIIDAETNNISLQVMEQLNVNILEMGEDAEGILVPIKCEVVSMWYRDDKEQPEHGTARIIILGPNDQELGQIGLQIDLTQYERLRTRSRLEALPIPVNDREFRLRFVVELVSNQKNVELARIPLEVVLNFPPQAEGA